MFSSTTRIIDILVLVAAAPFWMLALALTAALSRLLQGAPVFFKQERLGKNAQVFQVLKFRTMLNDADSFLDDQGLPTIDRITPLGRVLRRTSLDELPQLVNVLRGQMALVGPRPMLPSWLEKIPGGASHPRFTVNQGITGLAQVTGRNQLKWSKRLELDADFAKARSIALYLSVLLRTPASLFKPTVAHDRNSKQVDDLTR
ncbi:sugar transferase [Dietzia massiliensis]|uniref:sugar transferase n=1 Tax=Dietzia massiliensis TaxID=2697499 RepID=UPI001BD03F93|nr:sugar transferase [Dietzia massiliensis]MBS7548318.1 sugar transferase [Dietzia massiliensis]